MNKSADVVPSNKPTQEEWDAVINNGERFDPNSGFGPHEGNTEIHVVHYTLAASLLRKTDTVLDLACGTGYGCIILAEKAESVIGVDNSLETIRFAQKYRSGTNICYECYELFHYNLRFPAADVVTSFETIEHLSRSPRDTVTRLLALAKRLLICSVPYKEGSGNPFHNHFGLTAEQLLPTNLQYDVTILYNDLAGVYYSTPNDAGPQSLVLVINKAKSAE